MTGERRRRLHLCLATAEDREVIYRMRHAVYARELGQHPENREERLQDALDVFNVYLVAKTVGSANTPCISVETGEGSEAIVGFVSVTPPAHGRYSLDKYVARDELPFPCDDGLYEIRLLTVDAPYRNSPVTPLLIYAAFRYMEEKGGTRIVAIGRREVVGLYERIGLRLLGRSFAAGAVSYELMSATTAEGRAAVGRFSSVLRRLERAVDWQIDIPFYPCHSAVNAAPAQASCPHGGGEFWDAIGPACDTLERRADVVNADVLDAWFDPAPGVLAVLRQHLPWLLRTAPPTRSEGLLMVIAETRGIPCKCLVAAAGSSSLIYLALPRWLRSDARVLLPDPTYGEYAHALERVVGCRVDRMRLDRAEAYRMDPARWLRQLRRARYDLAVLVNPNNPTGDFVPPEALEAVLKDVPVETRVWVDEAYVDYVGPDASIERFAASNPNVFVCKSLSKGLALSGARTAYLVGPSPEIEALQALTPPWAVSLPAQAAAVAALREPQYYARRYQETHVLRQQLAEQLRQAIPEIDVLAGTANWLLCHLPRTGLDAATICRRCRDKGVFLRDLSAPRSSLGDRALRIAVKAEADNHRIAAVLSDAAWKGEPGS